jgi:hypothetical protein
MATTGYIYKKKRPMMDLDKSFHKLWDIGRDPSFQILECWTLRNIYVGEVG